MTKKVLPSGREGGAGELGVVQAVAGEEVDLTIRGDAHDPVHHGVAAIYGLVLGEPQVSPRRDDDVVRALHLAPFGTLVEELQGLARRQVAEDLAEACLAADGVVEPERPAGEVSALQASEPRGAHLLGVLVGLLGVHVLPDDLKAVTRESQVHVVVPPLFQGHDLEPATLLQRAGPLTPVVRDVAVEEADTGSRGRIVRDDLRIRVHDGPPEVVLREVGDAGRRVYVHGLVREEAHAPDRGSGQLVLGVVGVNLEDVTVARRAVLLAGEPGAPRRRPARAVVQGAGRGDEFLDARAIIQVHDDAGRPAGGGRVVGVAAIDRVVDRPVGSGGSSDIRRSQLVVAHQKAVLLLGPG